MKAVDIVVLIPHFNNPEGLLVAINSIQEKDPIDVLVVDDGSVKKAINKEHLVANIPENVTVYIEYLPENKGIQYALNFGLDYLRKKNYSFIARLDCDDICAENRFAIQLDYLKQHPEISMAGSFIEFCDPKGNPMFNLVLPTTSEKIKKRMFVNAMLIHPSIIFRREVLDKVSGYPTNFEAAEDYAFYFEVLKHFKLGNVDKFLMKCEINPDGISIKKRKFQIKNRLKIIWKHFDYSPYAFYGLTRNLIIYALPYSFILFLKKIIK